MEQNLIANDERYIYFVEQCQSTIIESATVSRWALVEGYWILGKTIREYMIREEYAKGNEAFLDRLAGNLKSISKRTLYRAVQFFDAYPVLNDVPGGKATSWTKVVTEYLPTKKDKPLDDFGGAYVKLDRFLKYVKDLVSESAYREFEHWGEKGRLLLEDYDSRRTAPVEILDEEPVLEIRGYQPDDWIDNTDLVIGNGNDD